MKNFQSTMIYSVSRYLALTIFVLISLGACNKDKADDPQPDGEYEVAGKWKVTAMTVSPPIDGATDYLAVLNKSLGNDCLAVLNKSLGNDCLATMTHIFKKDGTLAAEFPKECQNGDLSYDHTASWKVQGNKIIITNAGMTGEYDLEVTKSTMTWISSEVDHDSGKTFTLTYTYTRV